MMEEIELEEQERLPELERDYRLRLEALAEVLAENVPSAEAGWMRRMGIRVGHC